MKEVIFNAEFKTDSMTVKRSGTIEFDESKWNKIIDICNYRKADIFDVLEEYLETLTPEKAEEITFGWDI